MADREISLVVRLKDEASGAFKSIGSTALKAMGGLGVAAAAGGAALAKLAIDAAPMEGIQAAFRGVAEASGSSMKAMLQALQEGSAGMVSQRELMKTYNSAAQLVSPTFANQLPEAMQYLGKVASATGEDMGFMLDSLVKGVGRLSGPILDNLGIQVALSEATERASEMFGVEAGALTKAQTQAGMMSVVLEKLQKNTEAMPDISANAAAKMARFSATIADAKDQIGLAFLPVVGILADKLANLTNAILPYVTKGIATLANVLSQLLAGSPGDFPWEDILPPTLADLAYKAAGAFETIRSALIGFGQVISHGIKWGEILGAEEFEAFRRVSQPVRDVVYRLANAFFALYDGAQVLRAGLQSFFGYLEHGHGVFAAFQAMLGRMGFANLANQLNPVVMMLENFIGTIVAVAKKHAPAFEGALKAVATMIGMFVGKAVLIKALSPIVGMLMTLGKIVLGLANPFTLLIAAVGLFGAAWAENWGGIQEKTAALMEVLGPVFENVRAWLEQALPIALQTLATFWGEVLYPAILASVQFFRDTVIPTLQEIWIWFQQNIPQAIQTVADFFNTTLLPAIQTVISWIQENGPQIAESLMNAFSTIMSVVGPVVSEIVTFIQEMFGIVITWVQENWPLIQEVISDTMGTISTIISEVLTAIQAFWTEHGVAIVHFVSNMWTAIKFAVEQAINLVLGVIKAVLYVLSGHWEEAWTMVKDTVANIWEGIKTAVKTAAEALWGIVGTAVGKIPDIIISIGGRMLSAGKEIVQRLWDGLKGKMGEVLDWFNQKLDELTNLLPWNSPPSDPNSPLRGLRRAGGNIGRELLYGLQSTMPALENALMGLNVPMGGGGGGSAGASIVIQGPLVGHAVVREEGDLERLARLVADELALRARARGAFG